MTCICKDIQTDKDKQQHDLVFQLEDRVNKLEKALEAMKSNQKVIMDMIWENFRIRDNLDRG